jgi:hypothetical protein
MPCCLARRSNSRHATSAQGADASWLLLWGLGLPIGWLMRPGDQRCNLSLLPAHPERTSLSLAKRKRCEGWTAVWLQRTAFNTRSKEPICPVNVHVHVARQRLLCSMTALNGCDEEHYCHMMCEYSCNQPLLQLTHILHSHMQPEAKLTTIPGCLAALPPRATREP